MTPLTAAGVGGHRRAVTMPVIDAVYGLFFIALRLMALMLLHISAI